MLLVGEQSLCFNGSHLEMTIISQAQILVKRQEWPKLRFSTDKLEIAHNRREKRKLKALRDPDSHLKADGSRK